MISKNETRDDLKIIPGSSNHQTPLFDIFSIPQISSFWQVLLIVLCSFEKNAKYLYAHHVKS